MRLNSCRFKSCHPHQKTAIALEGGCCFFIREQDLKRRGSSLTPKIFDFAGGSDAELMACRGQARAAPDQATRSRDPSAGKPALGRLRAGFPLRSTRKRNPDGFSFTLLLPSVRRKGRPGTRLSRVCGKAGRVYLLFICEQDLKRHGRAVPDQATWPPAGGFSASLDEKEKP